MPSRDFRRLKVWEKSHRLPLALYKVTESFAYALLVDDGEAITVGLGASWEITEHFEVPEEMVRIQGALKWG